MLAAWVGGIASRGFCDAPSLTARTTSATVRCVNSASGDEEQQKVGSAKVSGRRELLNLAIGLGSAVLVGTASAVTKNKPPPTSPFDEKRLLDQNKRMQKLNNAPAGFPGFIREGTPFIPVQSKWLQLQCNSIWVTDVTRFVSQVVRKCTSELLVRYIFHQEETLHFCLSYLPIWYGRNMNKSFKSGNGL